MKYGPVTTVFRAEASLSQLRSRMNYGCSPSSGIDHVLTIVGWDENYWILKNSWGGGRNSGSYTPQRQVVHRNYNRRYYRGNTYRVNNRSPYQPFNPYRQPYQPYRGPYRQVYRQTYRGGYSSYGYRGGYRGGYSGWGGLRPMGSGGEQPWGVDGYLYLNKRYAQDCGVFGRGSDWFYVDME